MRWTRLAVAAILFPLTMPAAHALDLAESGGVPFVKTTVVTPTNVVAGIDNQGHQRVGNIGNSLGAPGVGLKFGNGVTSPAVETTVVVPTNVVAGIDNFGTQRVGNIANAGARPLPLKRH